MKNETYKQLSEIYKNKSAWLEQLEFVAGCLNNEDSKVQAKALWILGETGLIHGVAVKQYIPIIASFMKSENALLRERAINAIGRIGRNDIELIRPYFENLFLYAADSSEKVRIAFIWACEMIATNFPEVFESKMSIFCSLLDDEANRVRIEAPEIFRVLGKRKPEYVRPYLSKFQELTEKDTERVVRIHAAGAIKACSFQF